MFLQLLTKFGVWCFWKLFVWVTDVIPPAQIPFGLVLKLKISDIYSETLCCSLTALHHCVGGKEITHTDWVKIRDADKHNIDGKIHGWARIRCHYGWQSEPQIQFITVSGTADRTCCDASLLYDTETRWHFNIMVPIMHSSVQRLWSSSRDWCDSREWHDMFLKLLLLQLMLLLHLWWEAFDF